MILYSVPKGPKIIVSPTWLRAALLCCPCKLPPTTRYVLCTQTLPHQLRLCAPSSRTTRTEPRITRLRLELDRLGHLCVDSSILNFLQRILCCTSYTTPSSPALLVAGNLPHLRTLLNCLPWPPKSTTSRTQSRNLQFTTSPLKNCGRQNGRLQCVDKGSGHEARTDKSLVRHGCVPVHVWQHQRL